MWQRGPQSLWKSGDKDLQIDLSDDDLKALQTQQVDGKTLIEMAKKTQLELETKFVSPPYNMPDGPGTKLASAIKASLDMKYSKLTWKEQLQKSAAKYKQQQQGLWHVFFQHKLYGRVGFTSDGLWGLESKATPFYNYNNNKSKGSF